LRRGQDSYQSCSAIEEEEEEEEEEEAGLMLIGTCIILIAE